MLADDEQDITARLDELDLDQTALNAEEKYKSPDTSVDEDPGEMFTLNRKTSLNDAKCLNN